MTVITGREFGKCPRCGEEMEFRFEGEFECRSGVEILKALEKSS
jgi:hypothetical protein